MLAANLDWEQPVEYEDLFIAPETNDRLTEQCRLCCQHCNLAAKRWTLSTICLPCRKKKQVFVEAI